MPTLSSVMAGLKSRASEKTRATYIRHGAPPGQTLGVSVADQKLIAKTLKKQQALACELYATGVFEAMYLAGIIADGSQLTAKQLNTWAAGAANMPMVSEYTVPWVAVENPHARDLAVEWINSRKEHVAAAGWRTYTGLVITLPDDNLDLPEVEALLRTIVAKIGTAPNRVRSCMNSFLIATGTYVAPLLKAAQAAAKQIGVVAVDVGDTACKVPSATDALAKVQASGRSSPKRKTIRC